MFGFLHKCNQDWWRAPICRDCFWCFPSLPLLYLKLPIPSCLGLNPRAGFHLGLVGLHYVVRCRSVANAPSYRKQLGLGLMPVWLQNFCGTLVYASLPDDHVVSACGRSAVYVVPFWQWYHVGYVVVGCQLFGIGLARVLVLLHPL